MPVSRKRKATVDGDSIMLDNDEPGRSKIENAKKKKRLSSAERKVLVRARVDKWAATNTAADNKSPPGNNKSAPKASTTTSLGKNVASSKISDLSKTPKRTKKEKLAPARAKAALWNQQQQQQQQQQKQNPTTTTSFVSKKITTTTATSKKLEFKDDMNIISSTGRIPKKQVLSSSSSSRRKSTTSSARSTASTTTRNRRRSTRNSFVPVPTPGTNTTTTTHENNREFFSNAATAAVTKAANAAATYKASEAYSTGDSDMESISSNNNIKSNNKVNTTNATAKMSNERDGYSTGDSDMESVVDLRMNVDPVYPNLSTVMEQETTITSSNNPYATSVTINRNTAPTNNNYSYGQKQKPEEQQHPLPLKTTSSSATTTAFHQKPTNNFISPLAPTHLPSPPTTTSLPHNTTTSTTTNPPSFMIPFTTVRPETKSILRFSNKSTTSHLQEMNQPSPLVDCVKEQQQQLQLPTIKEENKQTSLYHKFETPKKLSSTNNEELFQQISLQQQQQKQKTIASFRRFCWNTCLFLAFVIAFFCNIIMVYLVLDWTTPYWKATTTTAQSSSFSPSAFAANRKKIPIVNTKKINAIKTTTGTTLCFQNTIFVSNDTEDINKNENNTLNDFSDCLPCPIHGICQNHQLVACEHDSFYQLFPITKKNTNDNNNSTSSSNRLHVNNYTSCQLSKQCQQVWTSIQQQLESATLSHMCSIPLSQQQHTTSNTVYRSIIELDWNQQYETCYHPSILSHYNLTQHQDSTSITTTRNDVDESKRKKIGLMNFYVKKKLSLPWSCYFQLLCKQLLWLLIIQLPLYALRFTFVQLTTNPKQSAYNILGGYILLKIVRLYRHRQFVKEQVRLVREEVRNLLIQDKIQLSSRKQPSQEAEGCAILHMRDHIGFQLYPDDTTQRVEFLYKYVWPKVEQDINADNRIAKSIKYVPNKGQMKWWTWIATTSSTPNHRSTSSNITPNHTKQE